MRRYVIVELDTDDWGMVDPATYVNGRDMRGFMGAIRAANIDPDPDLGIDPDMPFETLQRWLRFGQAADDLGDRITATSEWGEGFQLLP
jgi:hypothetical protein